MWSMLRFGHTGRTSCCIVLELCLVGQPQWPLAIAINASRATHGHRKSVPARPRGAAKDCIIPYSVEWTRSSMGKSRLATFDVRMVAAHPLRSHPSGNPKVLINGTAVSLRRSVIQRSAPGRHTSGFPPKPVHASGIRTPALLRLRSQEARSGNPSDPSAEVLHSGHPARPAPAWMRRRPRVGNEPPDQKPSSL
jgi:hypothetical protein